jgi:hypothetical protein
MPGLKRTPGEEIVWQITPQTSFFREVRDRSAAQLMVAVEGPRGLECRRARVT